jgi:hypothetical protein
MGEVAVTKRGTENKNPLHPRSDAEWRLYKIAHVTEVPAVAICGGESAARFSLLLTQVI